MRITREAKEATHQRILTAARRLFVERGFEATTTRELAAQARIATGTLFNYFESKEALATALVVAALDEAHADFERRLGSEELTEALFLHVAAGLRRLEPYRGFVGDVLESALSPFARSGVAGLGDELRARHLETVEALIAERGGGTGRPGSVALHLYWTLYLGLLGFWTRDESPGQEDTLAVLDESLRVFVLALSSSTSGPGART